MILQGSATKVGTGAGAAGTGGFLSNMDPFTIAAIGAGLSQGVGAATGNNTPASSQSRAEATGGTAYSGGNYFGNPFVLNGSGTGEGVAGGYGYSGLPSFQGFESAGSDPNQTRIILLALGAVVLIWLLRKK